MDLLRRSISVAVSVADLVLSLLPICGPLIISMCLQPSSCASYHTPATLTIISPYACHPYHQNPTPATLQTIHLGTGAKAPVPKDATAGMGSAHCAVMDCGQPANGTKFAVPKVPRLGS